MKNFAVNVITAILAVLLSIAFFVTALGAVVFHMLSSFTKADRITAILESIDYSSMLPDTDDLQAVLGEIPVDNQIVNEIMGSRAVEDLVDQYTEDFSAVLNGEEAVGLNSEDIMAILDENMDEIVTIVQENTDLEIQEEVLRDEITKAVEENVPTVLESLPKPEEVLQELDPELMKTVKTVVDPKISLILLGISLVLAALIYACRWPRFGGFIWVGVDCAITAVPVGILLGVFNLAKSMILGLIPLDASLVNAAIAVLNQSLFLGLGVLLGGAVLFIILGAVLRNRCKSEPDGSQSFVVSA